MSSRETPFEQLPQTPTPPHDFKAWPMSRVVVRTARFGIHEAAYHELGQGAPLVLLHGLMTSSYSWRYVATELARTRRVIVPDLPGCGASPAVGAALTPPALADWLAAFLKAVDADGADVVGNSMGGYVAMWLALRDPKALRSLLVVHAPGIPTPKMRALHRVIRVPGVQAALRGIIARSPERWVYRNVHYHDASRKSLEEIDLYAAPLRRPEGVDAFLSGLQDTLSIDGMAAFVRTLRKRKSLGVPTRLLYTNTDRMVPPVVGRRLAKLLPDASIVWFSDVSHFAHVDDPGAFVQAVQTWLTEART